VWDLFHPSDNARGPIQNNPNKYRRPLPEIKRTEKYESAWQNAPFASDYQDDQQFHQSSSINQMRFD
jgi:hypothetical protein